MGEWLARWVEVDVSIAAFFVGEAGSLIKNRISLFVRFRGKSVQRNSS